MEKLYYVKVKDKKKREASGFILFLCKSKGISMEGAFKRDIYTSNSYRSILKVGSYIIVILYKQR